MKGRIAAAGPGPCLQNRCPSGTVLLDPAGTALPGGIPDHFDIHLHDDPRRVETALARDLGRARQFS